jgi:protein-L-isoaspartate(D-aspartate) O-methyltransferase
VRSTTPSARSTSFPAASHAATSPRTVRPSISNVGGEIGTGSGYQTAILCEMGAKVYTVERQFQLYKKTKDLLARLNYHAKCFLGDSFNGIPERNELVYDRILVTCGAPEVPEGLMRVLKVGGIMVIPVGGEEQRMLRITKLGDTPDQWQVEDCGDAKFVPMLQGRNY